MNKFLDAAGVQYLWKLLSLKDYPNNEMLMAVIRAIDETKADKKDLEELKVVDALSEEDILAIIGSATGGVPVNPNGQILTEMSADDVRNIIQQ